MRTLILIIVSLLCGKLQSQTIQNWEKLDYGPTPFQPFSVAETDDEVFAVAYNKLFKADDPLGNSWSEVTGLPENYNVDFIKTSSELLVVMLNQNKHEISGFLVFEMYVSDDNGESFTHVRTLTHRVYGRDSRINVTGKIITYSDGEDTFRGDLRSYISYDSGRTWENLTDYDLLFLTESEPGKVTYRDDGALKIYDETTQTWTDIPLPAVFSTTDYFTLGDTIATIKDYILYLYVPNVDRVIRKPSTIQNLPNQIRRRGELYLRDNLNWIIGSNRGRTWDTIRYSSPSSLTSQGSYSYSAKNDILFFCNDFEAFDIGDPAQPLEAVRFMQNEDHYRIVRPINDEAFVSRIREKTVVNLHVASGSITNRINAINLNTARIEARNQTVIATWPEGIRVRKDDGTIPLTFSIEMQPRSLQCIGDTCVFVSASEELYMSKDAGENWTNFSMNNFTNYEADALMLQPNGMYFGRNDGNSNVLITYHDFDNQSTMAVTQVDWRDIVSRPSFRIANYNLWITKSGIYRAEDNTGDLELLPDTNFPFIRYWGDRELVRVSNLVERGDSIIVTGGNMKRPFVSTDRGESWTEWAGPLPSGNVNDAILVGGRLLLATSNGLFIEPGGISGLSETKTSSVARAVCFPNPAAVGQVIQIELPAGTKTESHASIAVLSTDGRLVAAEQDYPTTAGQVTVPRIQQTGSYCIVGEVDGRWFSSMVVIK